MFAATRVQIAVAFLSQEGGAWLCSFPWSRYQHTVGLLHCLVVLFKHAKLEAFVLVFVYQCFISKLTSHVD